MDRDHVEPVKQVFPEITLLNLFFQITMGGGDDANIHSDRFAAADRFELPLLKYFKDLYLQVGAHVADLVQKYRTAVGHFELSGFGGGGAGKCAFNVSEEFTFQKILRNGTTINRNKRLVPAIGTLMDDFGCQTFAGSGFPIDKDSTVAVGHPLDEAEYVFHGAAFSNNPLEAMIFGDTEAGHAFL